MAEDDFYEEERPSSGPLILLAGLAFLLALGALAWSFSLQNRLTSVESRLNQAQEQNVIEASREAELRRELRATTEAFGEKVGVTQRQIEARANDLLRQQQAATSRLAQQAADTRRQVNNVSSQVSSVQTDVGGVKQDVASTRQELAATEQQLHAAIGDMGVQSGLIAKNSQELDYLKHLGDRNYFEFTLRKNQPPVAVSTIKLRLRKADAKHSRFTLDIFRSFSGIV